MRRTVSIKNRVTGTGGTRTSGTGVYEANRRNWNWPIIMSMISDVISIISIISTFVCFSKSILFSCSLSTVSFIRICNCNCNMNDRCMTNPIIIMAMP